MNVSKILGAVAVLLMAGTLAAQTLVLNKLTDWQKTPNLSEENGTLIYKGKVCRIMSSQIFKIDKSKVYTLSLEAKADGLKDPKKESRILVGFVLCDKDQKDFIAWNYFAVPNSCSEVVADAKKGDKALLVKDLSKVKHNFVNTCLVGDAKTDFSDLPNRNMLSSGIQSIAKEGANWKIVLRNPLAKDVKAGTFIRIHQFGGYMYTAGLGNIGPQWKKLSGKTNRNSFTDGIYTWTHWPRCAVYCKVLIVANENNAAAENQFRNVTLSIQ